MGRSSDDLLLYGLIRLCQNHAFPLRGVTAMRAGVKLATRSR